jgi:hypothetical protein
VLDGGAEIVRFAGHGPTSSPEPIANAAGEVLMYGILRGGPLASSGRAAWVEGPSGSQIAFHDYMTFPGISSGGRFRDFASRELAFDDEGNVATIHNFAGGQGVWMFNPDIPGLSSHVANTGMVHDGLTINEISDLRLAAGRVAFHTGPGIEGLRGGEAIFAKQFGDLNLIAAAGRPAPGFGPEATYAGFLPRGTAMNDRGVLAFMGAANDPALPRGQHFAVWRSAPGKPVELVLTLNTLAGADPIERTWASELVMNNNGQLAFLSSGGSLWTFDPEVGPRRIARQGDSFSLLVDGVSVSKTLANIFVGGFPFSALPTGRYLSDEGEVVFVARFSDNTYAVIAWSPVPEPNCGTFALAIGIALSIRSGRPRGYR